MNFKFLDGITIKLAALHIEACRGNCSEKDLNSIRRVLTLLHTNTESSQPVLASLTALSLRVEKANLKEIRDIIRDVHELFFKILIVHSFKKTFHAESQSEIIQEIFPFVKGCGSFHLSSVIESMVDFNLEEIKQTCSFAAALSQNVNDTHAKGFILKEFSKVLPQERKDFFVQAQNICENVSPGSAKCFLLKKLRKSSAERRAALACHAHHIFNGISDKNGICSLWKATDQFTIEHIPTFFSAANDFCTMVSDWQERLAIITTLANTLLMGRDLPQLLDDEKQLSAGCHTFHRSSTIQTLLEIDTNEIPELLTHINNPSIYIRSEEDKALLMRILKSMPSNERESYCSFLITICNENRLWNSLKHLALPLQKISTEDIEKKVLFSSYATFYLKDLSLENERLLLTKTTLSLDPTIRYEILELGKQMCAAVSSAIERKNILEALAHIPSSTERKLITDLLAPFFDQPVKYLPSDLITALYAIPEKDREEIRDLSLPIYQGLKSRINSGWILDKIYKVAPHNRLFHCEETFKVYYPNYTTDESRRKALT